MSKCGYCQKTIVYKHTCAMCHCNVCKNCSGSMPDTEFVLCKSCQHKWALGKLKTLSHVWLAEHVWRKL
jgi:hypothetical protein